MSVIAIIPARGGSKGIPRKNLQPIGGIPLVGWTVRAALASDVDAVYVSTDSGEIATAARAWGAQVIDRPADLAADEVPTAPVIRHALEVIGERPEKTVILQCTSPLTTASDINSAVAKCTEEFDAIASAREDHGFIFRRDGVCLTYSQEERGRPRQRKEPRYRVDGAIFVIRGDVRDLLPDRLGFFNMPSERSIDIDDPVDLHLAESLLSYNQAWIVLGAGPDAREMLALARARHPTAKIIATNEAIELFEPPDTPTAYFLTDQNASRTYYEPAKAMQKNGCRLVTLKRAPESLKSRRVDHFDEFLKFAGQGDFVRGSYGSAGLSGLIGLQYAINQRAKSVHMVGMNGYTGKHGGDYFDGHEPDNKGRKRHMHTETVIQPFTQSCVDVCPDVDFVFYGQLNYSVQGSNVSRVTTRDYDDCCANLA